MSGFSSSEYDDSEADDSHTSGSQPIVLRTRTKGQSNFPTEADVAIVDEVVSTVAHRYDEVSAKPVQSREQHRIRPRNLLSREYRDLLNTDIKDACSRYKPDGERLPASQIGASYWTSREKDDFFAQLSLTGPEDLPSLSNAVKTKSQSEIQVYLRLLQHDGIKNVAENYYKDCVTYSDIAAAVTITPQLEEQLNLAADSLAKFVDEREMLAEKEKFGDQWLIDEATADVIEQTFEQPNDDAKVEGLEPASSSEDEQGATLMMLPDAALRVLRPAAFLQLSRSLFMNPAEEQMFNWRLVGGDQSVSQASKEPAIYRSALEEFCNLTISLTRRLLHASLFQATSRLRANDRKDWNPIAAVREIDVRTAADLLGLRSDYKHYWTTVPRRCKLDVYTDSKRFADGRPLTRNGYMMTIEEAEAELGLEQRLPLPEPETPPLPDFDNFEILDVIEESDLWTDEDEVLDDEIELGDRDSRSQGHASNSKKRKRDWSPSMIHRVEDRYLEALDQRSSQEEEAQFAELLGLDGLSRSTEHQVIVPNLVRSNGVSNTHSSTWQDFAKYEAEWEHRLGSPIPEDFQRMDRMGKIGRKRRRRLYDAAQGQRDAQSISSVKSERHSMPPEEDGDRVTDDAGDEKEESVSWSNA